MTRKNGKRRSENKVYTTWFHHAHWNGTYYRYITNIFSLQTFFIKYIGNAFMKCTQANVQTASVTVSGEQLFTCSATVRLGQRQKPGCKCVILNTSRTLEIKDKGAHRNRSVQKHQKPSGHPIQPSAGFSDLNKYLS